MKAISRMVSRFCHNHPRFGIPELMKYIAIGNVIVFVGDMLTRGMFSLWIDFYPDLILQGQVWRLLSYVFIPYDNRILFLAISMYFYYIIGTDFTGIDNTELEDQNSAIIYDLHGRRVENPTKDGIYIVNGKKVVIK